MSEEVEVLMVRNENIEIRIVRSVGLESEISDCAREGLGFIALRKVRERLRPGCVHCIPLGSGLTGKR